MPCTLCGRVYCDHTPQQRGQTREQMLAELEVDAKGDLARVQAARRQQFCHSSASRKDETLNAGRDS